jgi:hypothetical protein
MRLLGHHDLGGPRGGGKGGEGFAMTTTQGGQRILYVAEESGPVCLSVVDVTDPRRPLLLKQGVGGSNPLVSTSPKPASCLAFHPSRQEAWEPASAQFANACKWPADDRGLWDGRMRESGETAGGSLMTPGLQPRGGSGVSGALPPCLPASWPCWSLEEGDR